MNKLENVFVLGMLVLVLLPATYAVETDKVMILSLHYDNGKVSLNDKLVKYGYAPDRILQPETGNKIEILDNAGNVLYSFNFEIPKGIYAEISDADGNIEGGLVERQDFDFALTIPYFEDAAEVKVLDESSVRIAGFEAREKEEKRSLFWTSIIGGAAVIVALIAYVKGRKKR